MNCPSGFYLFSEFIDAVEQNYAAIPKPKLLEDLITTVCDNAFDTLLCKTGEELPASSWARSLSTPMRREGRVTPYPQVSALSKTEFEIITDEGWDYKFSGLPVAVLVTECCPTDDEAGDPMTHPALMTDGEFYILMVFLTFKGNVVLYQHWQHLFAPGEPNTTRATVAKDQGDVMRFFGKKGHAKYFYRMTKIPAFVEV